MVSEQNKYLERMMNISKDLWGVGLESNKQTDEYRTIDPVVFYVEDFDHFEKILVWFPENRESKPEMVVSPSVEFLDQFYREHFDFTDPSSAFLGYPSTNAVVRNEQKTKFEDLYFSAMIREIEKRLDKELKEHEILSIKTARRIWNEYVDQWEKEEGHYKMDPISFSLRDGGKNQVLVRILDSLDKTMKCWYRKNKKEDEEA